MLFCIRNRPRAPRQAHGTSHQAVTLLTRPVLHRFLNLLLHCFKVEGSWSLHWRIFDCGLRQVPDVLLDQDEAPEFAGEKVVAVAEGAGIGRLAANHRRTLEGILANVDHSGHVGRGLFAWPAVGLRVERELEVIEAQSTQARAAEVEDFVALGWTSPSEKISLVVAIEVILVGPVAEPDALEELVGDIRIFGRSHQGGEPIQAREDAVLDRARFDPTRPANESRYAEATFADSAFGVLERRHAAIRPCEYFRAVVGGEDHDCVV